MKKYTVVFITLLPGLFMASQVVAQIEDVEYGGSVFFDIDSFDGVYNAEGAEIDVERADEKDSVSELRRARLYLKFGFAEDWSSKLQLSYDEKGGRTEVKDAYIRYKGWDFADITIGQDKEPFSLGLITSLKNSNAIERNIAGQAFRLGRNLGVNFAADSENYSWSIGLYDVGEYGSDITQGGGGKLAVTGRLTLSPINDNNQVLHLGSSFSIRDLNGAEFEIESNAEVRGSADVMDTRNFPADSLQQFALESAWIKDRLALSTEAYYQDVEGVFDVNSAIYTGYYVEGSYFLSNDSLRYKKGRFGAVKSNSDSGAWQLVLRHSYLDAEDNLDGMEITNRMLGINYYRKALKLMLNITSTDLNGYDVKTLDAGDAVSFRAQYRF
jgi:phosphate-selective porin OprO/OprP